MFTTLEFVHEATEVLSNSSRSRGFVILQQTVLAAFGPVS